MELPFGSEPSKTRAGTWASPYRNAGQRERRGARRNLARR
jgi:hypothetical protein